MSERQVGDEFEITPEMIDVAYNLLDQWMAKWNYFEDGLPGDDEVTNFVVSFIASARAFNPDSE